MTIPLKLAHQKFIHHLKERGRAEATLLAYGKDIEQLITFLEELKRSHVHEISNDDLRAFMARLEKTDYTPKSISRKTNSTRTFFKFLKINEYITDDPAALLSHPKFEPKPPRILSEVEYRALRDSCRDDTRTSAIVELLLQTGIRIGELAELKLEHLKLDNAEKKNSLLIGPGHKRDQREIPLNAAAVRALKSYLATRHKSKSDLVFITKNGRPLLIRNIRSTIDRYFKKAGIQNAKVNDLRHTFVAHHLTRGASLVLVSKIAGHKRLSTTEKYLQFVKNKPQETMILEEL